MSYPASVTDAIRLTPRLAFLDSGLHRTATGILPSRRIQDFLSVNDGEVGIDALKGPE